MNQRITMPSPSVVENPELLADLGDDLELVSELIELFLEKAPKLLSNLQRAVQSRDAKRLERAAHELKVAARNFGRSEAVNAALQLEVMGRKGDLAEVDVAHRTLRSKWAQLELALVEWNRTEGPDRLADARVAIPRRLR